MTTKSPSDINDITDFFERQLEEWPEVRERYDSLSAVETKEFIIDGEPFKIQYNPARAVSTGASVDKKSIDARPCFLCKSNRDPCQKSLPWESPDGTGYEILVNPFPVFRPHFTISLKEHTPQNIDGRLLHLLQLTRIFKGFTIFFNEAGYGASAPDHHHFQAVPSSQLPVWTWADNTTNQPFICLESASATVVDEAPVKLIFIQGGSDDEITTLYNKLIKENHYRHVNLVACYHFAITRLLIIPRNRHRPECYATGNDAGLMVSPASIDLSGVFILPRRKDFDNITPESILSVIKDVTQHETAPDTGGFDYRTRLTSGTYRR